MTMKGRVCNAFDPVPCYLWKTPQRILVIVRECSAGLIKLIIVVTNLSFQVICFFKDLIIDAMQTYANVFRGIVNIVSSIGSDDIEDFTFACIVLILCTGIVKTLVNFLRKNTHVKLFNVFGQRMTQSDNNNNPITRSHGQDACPPKRKADRRNQRNRRRYRKKVIEM